MKNLIREKVIEKKFCRLCKSRYLEQFLDLEIMPPSDAFLSKEDLLKRELSYPLKIYICLECGHIQSGLVINPRLLYGPHYVYDSSTTSTLSRHFDKWAYATISKFRVSKKSLIIDIGSNVGVLLAAYKRYGMEVLGIDPVVRFAKVAQANNINTVADFFSSSLAHKISHKFGQAAIVNTTIFAHVDDLDDFLIGVKHLLDKDGILVLESPYFMNLVKYLEYDTIYHEHLSYISLKPLVKFFQRHDLELFDVTKEDIHGGTIRYFVSRTGIKKIKASVKAIISEEKKVKLHDLKRLKMFAQRVATHREKLMSILYNIKKRGFRIVGVSAPAKGNTLLNYCHITRNILDYITEKAPVKIGMYTPGTHIPIYSDKRLFADHPDYALLLAWNFAKEIMDNLKEYKLDGGKFIIPIPTPRVIT